MAHQCKFCSAPFRRTFQPSQLPFLATLSYATRLPAGVLLDCPRNHGYCNPCMNDYLRTKLKEAEEGGDVFLIAVRCPDCKFGSYQIPDAEAEKILSKDDMIRWVSLMVLSYVALLIKFIVSGISSRHIRAEFAWSRFAVKRLIKHLPPLKRRVCPSE
jgi:hypothetical protein